MGISSELDAGTQRLFIELGAIRGTHQMSEREAEDQEPSRESEEPEHAPAKARRSFARLRRELNDDELASSAVQRLLLDDIDRLETETERLQEFRGRYHRADRQCAVLEERSKTSTACDILSGVCLVVGSAALTFAPNLWTQQPSGWICLTLGAALIVGGVAARVVRR